MLRGAEELPGSWLLYQAASALSTPGVLFPTSQVSTNTAEVHVDFTELRTRVSESAWANTKLPSTLDTKGCWLTDPAHLPVWDVALPVLSVAWWEQGRREEDPGLGVTLLSCA